MSSTDFGVRGGDDGLVRASPLRNGQGGMVRSRGINWPFVAIAVVALVFAMASCGQSGVKCSVIGDAYQFVGSVVSHHGNHAEFVIDSMLPTAGPRPIDAPVLAVGERVKVHYDGSTAQFLHVATGYDVGVFWLDNEYWSDIHTADRPCSGRTVYADGSSINTSLWARSMVREAVYVIALIVVGVVAVRGLRRRRFRERARAR